MDKRTLKKKKRAKEVKKNRNVIRNNISDQERMELNKSEQEVDKDGNFILKEIKPKVSVNTKADKVLNVYTGQQVHGN